MMDPMTLSEFLLARIGVEEGRARAALGLLGIETEWHRVEWLRQRGLTIADAQHMTHHAPRRVLARCAADRRIVEEHGANQHHVDPCDAHDASGHTIPCDTLRFLALPYADHPDYREEWRP